MNPIDPYERVKAAFGLLIAATCAAAILKFVGVL
jgi:hypothetical protein